MVENYWLEEYCWCFVAVKHLDSRFVVHIVGSDFEIITQWFQCFQSQDPEEPHTQSVFVGHCMTGEHLGYHKRVEVCHSH